MRSPIAVLILAASMLVAGFAAAQPVAASAPAPAWWNGTTCDTSHYPGSYALGASYNGIQACGPGPTQGGTDHMVHFFSGAWGENEWECVELVMRYMYLVYGVAPYSANGKDVVNNYSGSALTKVSNNGATLPSPGDILSYAASTDTDPAFGHTAIVTAVSVNSSGNGTVTVMQQNASTNGWGSVTVTANVLGKHVSGWLHNPNAGSGGTQLPSPGAIEALVHESRINLTWGSSPGATSYRVLRNGAVLATVATTTYLDTAVSPNQDYTYSIIALNSSGSSPATTAYIQDDSESADYAHLRSSAGPTMCGRAGDNSSQLLVCTIDTPTGWTTSYSTTSRDWGYTPGRTWLTNTDGSISYCRFVGTGNQLMCDRYDGTSWTQSASPPTDLGYSNNRAVLATRNGPAECGLAGDQSSQALVCTTDTPTGWVTSASAPHDWGYTTDRSWFTNLDGTVSYCRRVNYGDQIACDRYDGTTWTYSTSPRTDPGYPDTF